MAAFYPAVPLETLARRFRHFAGDAESAFSPFYARLSRDIAADPEVLALVADAPPSQPTPNMLPGAVHYLLLRAQKQSSFWQTALHMGVGWNGWRR